MRHILILIVLSIFCFNLGYTQEPAKAVSELSTTLVNREIVEIIENQSNQYRRRHTT